MARSGGPTVGLDIGSHTIKVAEVTPGRDGVTVRALGMAPTPPGSMENNVIIDAALLGQAVKKLLKEAGVSTKSSVSSVSGQSALVVRVIEVPKMSESELAETMRWEVERHVPFAANEVIMDFQPIYRPDTPPDAQNMEVLLAVAQQDMVDRHVEMLFAAGLSPAAIDVEPLAVARTYVELGPNPTEQKTVAIVNIGAVNTDIGIFRDGILAFPRTLPLAGESFTRALMAQMGLSEEQAEEYKRSHGQVIMDQAAQPQAQAPVSDAFLDFSVPPPIEDASQPSRMPFDFSEPSDTEPTNLAPGQEAPVVSDDPDTSPEGFSLPPPPAAARFDAGPDTGPEGFALPSEPTNLPATTGQAAYDPTTIQVFSAIAPVLGELVTEVRRSLEYYRGRSADGRIDEILLCGGTSGIRNLDAFFTSELGIPTRVASPFTYTNVAAKNHSPEYIEEIAPFFAVAVGLAARDMVKVPALAGAGGGKRSKKKK